MGTRLELFRPSNTNSVPAGQLKNQNNTPKSFVSHGRDHEPSPAAGFSEMNHNHVQTTSVVSTEQHGNKPEYDKFGLLHLAMDIQHMPKTPSDKFSKSNNIAGFSITDRGDDICHIGRVDSSGKCESAPTKELRRSEESRAAVDLIKRRSTSQMSQTDDEDKPELPLRAARLPFTGASPPIKRPSAMNVMYTNRANLQHTINVQQRLFTQQLGDRFTLFGKTICPPPLPARRHRDPENNICDKSKGVRSSPSTVGGLNGTSRTVLREPNGNGSPTKEGYGDVDLEWVVKRRSDGTRYITRRPVRNRMLKERARRVEEERRCLTTDDDDAMSELKVGRYWNKEDRKRHVESARSKRREKEASQRQRIEADARAPEPSNIVELSRRKMMRQRGRKTLDSFTTVQELLAHGSRESHGKMKHPLLSVTTV